MLETNLQLESKTIVGFVNNHKRNFIKRYTEN